MWRMLKYKGREYYYYSEDVTVGEYSGETNVNAQDADGNEYNIVWAENGGIARIDRKD